MHLVLEQALERGTVPLWSAREGGWTQWGLQGLRTEGEAAEGGWPDKSWMVLPIQTNRLPLTGCQQDPPPHLYEDNRGSL